MLTEPGATLANSVGTQLLTFTLKGNNHRLKLQYLIFAHSQREASGARLHMRKAGPARRGHKYDPEWGRYELE